MRPWGATPAAGADVTTAESRPALAGARKRPLWAVFMLTMGTMSLYFFVHLGLMWAEMKQARRDPSMRPIGHALAQLVPFYGWFRFHAHVRTLDELLVASGSPIRVSAGRATAMYVVIAMFALLAESQTSPLWLIFPSIAIYAAFAAWRQRLLNIYYDQISGHTVPERVHVLEWVAMAGGAVLLALAVAGVATPQRP